MIDCFVIGGSTRQGRFSEKPAQWILQHLQKRAGIEARLLDLRDFPMPFFDQAVSPATPGRAPYENEVVKGWTAAIAASDGFVFVTPEYNYGPSAVLKNAIDWVYPEWNRKAAAFVSYGSAMGARSVQQLRETAIELQIATVRSSVQIPVATLWAHFRGGDVDKGLAELETQAQTMIDDLLWWTTALKTARELNNRTEKGKLMRPLSRIARRTRGQSHGPITRLMSPSDFGRLLKPFVFLDIFDTQGNPFTGFGLHPHSGIATVTYVAEGSVSYQDTNGATGLLPAGGIEWMRAGGGVWHGGGAGEPGRTRGFRLWIALAPELELGPSESVYLAPEVIPHDGPARVLLGSYGTATSSIEAPSPMDYLAVRLKAGERWSYQPPTGHTVLWIAVGM